MHNPNFHMASTHEERKLIQCPNIKLVCHKYFQQEVPIRNKSQISVIFVRNVLKRGVKMPFKYTFCKSIFFQKLHMRGHFEKVHEGKNPFYVLFVKEKYPKEWFNWLITFPYFMKEKIHSKCDICYKTFEKNKNVCDIHLFQLRQGV